MADAQVRAAGAADADAVAEVQLSCWLHAYTGRLPDSVMESMTADRDQIASRWRESISSAPTVRHRVLVACAGPQVVGAAAIAPADDADADPAEVAELLVLAVAPPYRGRGHGSRLLNAATGQLRLDRFTLATAWVDAADTTTTALLLGAGWALDGASRVLDLAGDGAVEVPQHRLHTDLTEGG
jgi:ribosomal protein S18 acetylase RimI-like enzyme